MSAPRLAVPDPGDRDELAVFCARAVRLETTAAIRLRTVGDRVEAWAPTPFDALATHAARGGVDPRDVTVVGSDLLAALTVVGGPDVDAGTRCDERWRAPLPADATWTPVGEVTVAEADALALEGIEAGEGLPAGRLPAALLDRIVLAVPADVPGGDTARVPMRCVLALAGLGLLATGADEPGALRVSTGGSPGHDWLRLDVRGGAVVRRRRPALVLQPV